MFESALVLTCEENSLVVFFKLADDVSDVETSSVIVEELWEVAVRG